MNAATARLRPLPPTTVLSAFVVAGAVLLGPLVLRNPWIATAAVLGAVLGTAVFVHPPLAGYVMVVTPLLAGLGRGTVLPLIRPGEAVTLLVGAALLTRLLLALASGDPPPARLQPADASMFFLALAASFLPLLFLVARGRAVSQDDVLYSFQIVKFGMVYLIVRVSVRTEEQVGRCLRLSMLVAAVVAVIGILQALDLLGAREALLVHYPPTDDALFESSRASSTLAHPFAMADLMVFNLAIAGAWLARSGRRTWLVAGAALFAVGAIASGEFSGALALVVAVTALGVLTRRLGRAMLGLLPVAILAGLILQPVIDARLRGFSSPQGLPDSWLGRLHNLQSYVWPKLATGLNWVVGVRPSARVPIGNAPAPFVYIESGYTWLFWVGGIPLFVAFIVFLVANLRATRRVAAERGDLVGVAATAAFVALAVVAVLTVLDPHVTLRGSGDLLFALLALAYAGGASAEGGRSPAGDGLSDVVAAETVP